MDLLVDGLVRFAEVLAALAVAHDDVLHAQILQHVGGDFAGVSALLLKVDVLSAHRDPQVLESLHSNGNIAGGNADQGVAPLGAGHDLLQFLGKLLGLGCGHVHFPVAGNHGLTVSAVHKSFLLLLFKSIVKVHIGIPGKPPGPPGADSMQNLLFYSENCGFCQAFFAESAIFPGKYRGKCLVLLLGPPACKNVSLIQQTSHASSEQAAHPALPPGGQKLARSAVPPLPTGPAALGSGGGSLKRAVSRKRHDLRLWQRCKS